jgi:formylmethanofuran dehydrogenase subunit E
MQIKICSYTIEEYIERVKTFHSHTAPGVILGGFMVDLANRHLSKEGFFDAISETDRCLPDAIQLLTPCTVGNGWLRVFNVGRFALTIYEKSKGEGVRVSVSTEELDKWPEIKSWFFKLKPKKEQDSRLLMEQILQAGAGILKAEPVIIDLNYLKTLHRGGFAVCPRCKESYPAADGEMCLGCQGKMPYLEP